MEEERTVIYLGNGNVIVNPPPENVGNNIRGYKAGKFLDWGDCMTQEDLINDAIRLFEKERDDNE